MRSSAGHEAATRDKDSASPNGSPGSRCKHMHKKTSVAPALSRNSMPRNFHHHRTQRKSAEDLHRSSGWNQVYEGEWLKDKRSGHGILKVHNCFTYYGQWRDNTRTGYGVLVYESQTLKNGKVATEEEVKEEGEWKDGKLIEPVKYKRFRKSELELRVREAHTEAIRAATLARDKAVVAEAKANAAAARSKVAESRAMEAHQHASITVKKVQAAAKVIREIAEDAGKVKQSVRKTAGKSESKCQLLLQLANSISSLQDLSNVQHLLILQTQRLLIWSLPTQRVATLLLHASFPRRPLFL